jgi:hypothetical protein
VTRQKNTLNEPKRSHDLHEEFFAEGLEPILEERLSQTLPPYMPAIDERDNIDEIFAHARRFAAERSAQGPRQVVLVTPGRMTMAMPCPPDGTMPTDTLTPIKALAGTDSPLNVTVIGFTELEKMGFTPQSVNSVIPFFGYLLGFGYVGHHVVIFEGHPSTLRTACADTDLLIVDGGMIPHLHAGWVGDAYEAMRPGARIVIFGRDGSVSLIQPKA